VEFRISGPLEIIARGTPVRVDRPLERKVWDDAAPDTAGKQIRNCVSRLRQHLPAEDGTEPVIRTEPSGYLLRLGGARLDAHAFQAALDSARRLAAADRRSEAVAELRVALAQWRGPALVGITGRRSRRPQRP
jgi:DNA-binding SARP family transcriptional activator